MGGRSGAAGNPSTVGGWAPTNNSCSRGADLEAAERRGRVAKIVEPYGWEAGGLYRALNQLLWLPSEAPKVD